MKKICMATLVLALIFVLALPVFAETGAGAIGTNVTNTGTRGVGTTGDGTIGNNRNDVRGFNNNPDTFTTRAANNNNVNDWGWLGLLGLAGLAGLFNKTRDPQK